MRQFVPHFHPLKRGVFPPAHASARKVVQVFRASLFVYGRFRMSGQAVRLLRIRDVFDLLMIATLGPIAWFLPPGTWITVTRILALVHVGLLGERANDSLEALAPEVVHRSARELEVGFRQHCHWELLEILREHAPWGWKVSIGVTGAHHIDQGLERGHGVILWFCPFTHADIVFKRGLHQRGYEIVHLSHYTHGFSDTRFGVKVLNPIKTGVERRYLKERVLIGRDRSKPAVERLKAHLKTNGLVSITAIQSGRRRGERPFLGGRLQLAKGAPSMAFETGAPLLPVFVVPGGEGYVVCIEAPLVARSPVKEEAEEELLSAYVPLLERYVRAHPDLWRGWLGTPNYWRPQA